MKKIKLGNSKEAIPVLGQGTYGIFKGESETIYRNWRNVFKKGVELGMNHLDTAELYGNGQSEIIVGEVANSFNRKDVFITTKLLPSRKTEKDIRKALNESLERLNLDYVDLYLLHWLEENTPLKLVMELFEEFVDIGKTRFIGVSNLSILEFKKAQSYLKHQKLVTNQVKLNIKNQKELENLKDFYNEEQVTLTAYTPLAKNDFKGLNSKLYDNLTEIAKKHNATKAQIALAWLIHHKNVIAIPRTSNVSHVRENAKASEIELSAEEIKKLSMK